MPFRILFVCIGNVCRSPLAERLLALRLTQAGVSDRFSVASAGVRAMRGRGMQVESARTLLERGGDPDGFLARQLTEELVGDADLVLAATVDVRSRVLEESPRALRRTFTVREFVALAAAATGVKHPPGREPMRESGRESGRDSGAHAGPAASEVVPLPEFVRVCAEARGSLTIDDYDVTDPIGGSTGVFDEVAALLDGELGTLAAALIAASGSLPSDPDRATS